MTLIVARSTCHLGNGRRGPRLGHELRRRDRERSRSRDLPSLLHSVRPGRAARDRRRRQRATKQSRERVAGAGICFAPPTTCKVREPALIVRHEDGAVLQQRPVGAPLCASGQLATVHRQLSRGRYVEAGRHSGHWRSMRRRGQARSHAEHLERAKEQSVDSLVRRLEISRRLGGCRHAVGDLAVVQDRATAGGSANDVQPRGANGVQVISVAGGLIPAERDRRRTLHE